MKKFIKAISKALLAAFIITNTLVFYPAPTFALDDSGKKKKVTVATDREKYEIIIKYKDESKSENVKSSVKSKNKLKKLDTKKKFKKSKIDVLEMDKSDDINKVVSDLRKDPNVEYVQPNYKLDIAAIPSDPMFNKQWGLLNNGQDVEGQTGRSNVDINAMNAWNITEGSSTVVVGILDTGLDINHKDLKDNIYSSTTEIAGDGIDNDNNGYIDDKNGWDFVHNDSTVYDDSSKDIHGTQVAGILAASANSEGIKGVAPNVKILPLKFINGNTGYTCDAIDAIEYAMAKGVKIINCSFGGSDNNFALKDTMKNSGILFVAAAGNRGTDTNISPVYPACFDIPNVISVAAIDSKGVIANFSSFGSKISVAAPGVNVLSTTPGDTYDYLSGTSVATPFVAGIAALLKSSQPTFTFTQIADRIKQNVVPCTTLTGKVATGGRVDAYAALSNTPPQVDTYNGEGNPSDTVPPGQQGGDIDTWYTMDQLAKIKERLHYGESGVNPASGNYSFTVNDMSVPAPGFNINISRSYNSKDDKSTPLGRGWTFGFEGKAEGTDLVTVALPTGGVQRFRKNTDGTFKAEDSRSTLVKNADNTYTMTTKDQYTYGFNSNGWLYWMKDRNGNTVNIAVDANGKITKVTDTVGRDYIINYNAAGLIDNITDAENRLVKYEYDTNNHLVRVIDPAGSIMRYAYDGYGFLTQIDDHNNKLITKLSYNHSEGENQHKVSQATDALGDVVNYAYDMTNRKTTITDMNNRISTYWFDTSMYTIQVQDPDGKSTYTDYYLYGGKNQYGDVKSVTDRNGNKTEYILDDKGNVKEVINHNPERISKVYEYDDKNNVIMEQDESGNRTYNIYDANKINLIKKVQPLNGTDVYVEGTSSPADFAITTYSYYTKSEAQTLFNCSASALLKSVTDPEGNTTTYTYDRDGNIKTIKDPEDKVTTFEYNNIGWKTASTSPKTYRVEYTYDKNGLLEKTALINGNGEVSRTVYDTLGRKIQEISPNQYNPALDNLAGHTYTDTGIGTRYAYYDSGKVWKITDAENNITSYTYDVYGNVLTETRQNGSIYRNEYDVMDRLVKTYYRDSAASSEVLLKQMEYAVLADGKSQTTETRYLNDTDKAVTVTISDYAGRAVEKQNPDGTKVKISYNPNGTVANSTNANGSITYFKYDGLNRLTEQWTPFEISNGDTSYSYSKTEYYKNGLKKNEITGKDKVALFAVPSNTVSVSYTYYKNGKQKTLTDNEGRKTEYFYDDNGNVTKQEVYTDATSKLTTEYEYNHLDKVQNKKVHLKAGDIYGNDFTSAADTVSITSYTYDKNGNVKTVTTPDNITTTYEYDNLNRQKSASKPCQFVDESGISRTENVVTSTTYNFEGKPLTTTDANGNVTTYEYNKRGLLVKVIDANEGVTAYDYDRAGRKIIEVSPKNYDAAKPLNQLNRIEYNYDVMDRVKTKTDIYFDSQESTWVTLVTKSFLYDNNGNVIKELDALGYKSGSGSTLDEKILTGYGTQYTYNLAGKVVTMLDAESQLRSLPYTAKYEYDGLGMKTAETNAVGVTTLYVYDDGGNVKEVQVKKASDSIPQIIKSSTYDLAGRMLTQTDGNQNTTSYSYNAFGKLRKVITPGDASIPSSITSYQYDMLGNLKKQFDNEGKVILTEYDNNGRVLSSTERYQEEVSSAITVSVKYDKNGNKRFETDGNGTVKENVYDELNRIVETKVTVSGVLHTTGYAYDANGNQTVTTDWRGNTYTNVYDPLNRLVEKRDPYTTIQRLTYYENNLQKESYDALGNMTVFSYDRNGRLISTKDPAGHITRQYYDDAGNISAKNDGNGISTAYTYDEYNRLKEVKNPKGEITGYTYDLNGNMLTQTDGKGNKSYYQYNAANKLVKRIDPLGEGDPEKTETYTYYSDGQMKTKTDRSGRITNYTYDVHGRMESQSVDGKTISYTYDNNGNQLTMTDSTGTTIRTYDELNRVLTKTVPNIGTATFTYDTIEANGSWSETTTDPKTNVTKRVYDKAGRLWKVIADGNTTTNEYYANGSKKSVTYPDGAKEEYTYYADGLNETLVNKKADGTEIDRYTYTYDAAHNQTSKIDSKGVTYYGYDQLNRLKTVTEPNGKVTSYTFDEAGNRLFESVKAGDTELANITYTYNEQNRLMKTVTQEGQKTETVDYKYDSNGNMVSKSKVTSEPTAPNMANTFNLYVLGKTTSKDLSLYEYDVWNQLVKSTEGDKTVSHAYNGDGYRVEKTVNGQTTRFLYEGDKVILEVDGSGSQTAKNTYGGNTLLSRTMGTDTAYYMYNGHADVTALLTNGTVSATYYYDAFGNILEKNENAGISNPYTYAGYRYDSEIGLYYLNARFYDPKIARFMQEDTYRARQGDMLNLNMYAYAASNPIRYTDPTGHVVTEWDKAHLSTSEISQLESLGNSWNYWNDRANVYTVGSVGYNRFIERRNTAHVKAEAIRNKYRQNNEIGTSSGYTYVVGDNSSAILNDTDTSALENNTDTSFNGSPYIPEAIINLQKPSNAVGMIEDRNYNGVPDVCDSYTIPSVVSSFDTNNNGISDAYEMFTEQDSNINLARQRSDSPIQVRIDGNNIIFDIDIGFSQTSNANYDRLSSSSKTYRELIIEGIMQWEGSVEYNGKMYNIVINLNELSEEEIKKRIKMVDVVESNGKHTQAYDYNMIYFDTVHSSDQWDSYRADVDNPWNVNAGSYIKLGTCKVTSEQSFSNGVAHEFGHSLGLMDAYTGFIDPKNPKKLKSGAKLSGVRNDDIMWGAYRINTANVSELDRRMVLEAFITNKQQGFTGDYKSKLLP